MICEESKELIDNDGNNRYSRWTPQERNTVIYCLALYGKDYTSEFRRLCLGQQKLLETTFQPILCILWVVNLSYVKKSKELSDDDDDDNNDDNYEDNGNDDFATKLVKTDPMRWNIPLKWLKWWMRVTINGRLEERKTPTITTRTMKR